MGAGLIERLLATAAPRAGAAADERMWGTIGPVSSAGIPVTPGVALTYSAVFACVSVIAEDESTLPFPVFERRGDSRIPRPEHPVNYVLNERPNAQQTSQEWREWMTAVAAMRGEALSRMVPGRRGAADQLVPMEPDQVAKETLPGGQVRYRYRHEDGRTETLLADQVFRLPGRMGLSVVALARETIGAAIAGDRYTGSQWRNGIKPKMGLQHPKTLSKEAQSRLAQSVDAELAGIENAGRTAVFEEGMTWVKIGVDPKDAQFLESRQFSVEEVCRWFRMQPHKVAHLLRSTNNNIEHQGIEHVTDTMRPWCVRWETSAKVQLLEAEPDLYAKHNMDALLRGDALARSQALEIQRRNGVRNADEWRALEDLNPRSDPGGQVYWDVQPGTGQGGSDPGGKQPSKAQRLAESAAARVVAREIAAMTRKAAKFASVDEQRDPDAWAAWRAEVTGFYAEHRTFVQETLAVGEFVAREYCEGKAEELLAGGVSAMGRWEERDTRELAELALGGED